MIVHGVGVAWGLFYDIIRGWIAGKWLSRAIWGMRNCVREESVLHSGIILSQLNSSVSLSLPMREIGTANTTRFYELDAFCATPNNQPSLQPHATIPSSLHHQRGLSIASTHSS